VPQIQETDLEDQALYSNLPLQKCLTKRFLASDEAADEFRDKVLALAGDNLNLVDQKARAFWNSN